MDRWLGYCLFYYCCASYFRGRNYTTFSAEAIGVTHDKTHPRIDVMAKWLWMIYAILTIAETVLLMIGGMSFFDAVCHSFSTTATGGYSTKQASVAYWNSPFIEYVIAIFMILSGINFSLYFMCLKGKGKRLFQDDEFRWFMKSVSILTLVITFALVFRIIMIGKRHSAGLCFKWLRRIRHAALQRMIITCGHLLHGCFLFLLCCQVDVRGLLVGESKICAL